MHAGRKQPCYTIMGMHERGWFGMFLHTCLSFMKTD
jgi:hypothetical protein